MPEGRRGRPGRDGRWTRDGATPPRRPKLSETRRKSVDGPAIDKDRRRGAERVEFTVQASRRDDDEAVHLSGERFRRAHLFLLVLTGVDEEHLELGLSAVRSTARTSEAKWGS